MTVSDLRPQLVCLDLSDCEFQDQQALLSALSTLSCLRTLVLEGNPFTLASCYTGFTMDGLPKLSCLDFTWISAEERHCFRGLAEMSGECFCVLWLWFLVPFFKCYLSSQHHGFFCKGLTLGRGLAKVSVRRIKGISDPLMSVDENRPNFPVVPYSCYIIYEFFSHQTPVDLVMYPSQTFQSFYIALSLTLWRMSHKKLNSNELLFIYLFFIVILISNGISLLSGKFCNSNY